MQAVILAAGKGTRMGELLQTLPKPLLQVLGKNLLQLKIEVMPEEINEIIFLIGYRGDEIKNFFGNSYKNKKITYIEDKELKGTAGSLWKAQNILNERFLVMMGDDIYSGEDMLLCLSNDWALLAKRAFAGEVGDRLLFDEHGKLSGFMNGTKYRESFNEGGLMNTGMYALKKEIFEFPLIKLKTKDEYGLPQTILNAINNIDLKIVETDFWIQITSPEDLQKAEKILNV